MPLNKKNTLKKLTNQAPPLAKHSCILVSAGLALSLAAIAFLINSLWFKFSGNNYFPPSSLTVGLSLFLIALGCRILFNSQHPSSLISCELLFFFLIMAIIAVMTNAAQYAPFPIIDHYLIAIEAKLGINMVAIVEWAASYPRLHQLLSLIYASLDYQMAFIPILIILLMKQTVIREYYFLLLVSAVIGFSFYYFFPTIAPASMLDSPAFLDAQRATGIKFQQIHHHLQPSTLQGGLIAMPSFHALWAWYCLYLCRSLPWLFYTLLPINILVVIACVLLGWHYPIDIVGSIIIALISHGLAYHCRGQFENYTIRAKRP